ncbi:hypothetical protein, partial [Rhizobium leguminosarum]
CLHPQGRNAVEDGKAVAGGASLAGPEPEQDAMTAILVGGFDEGGSGRSASRHHVAHIADEPQRRSLAGRPRQ